MVPIETVSQERAPAERACSALSSGIFASGNTSLASFHRPPDSSYNPSISQHICGCMQERVHVSDVKSWSWSWPSWSCLTLTVY